MLLHFPIIFSGLVYTSILFIGQGFALVIRAILLNIDGLTF